jgi:anti-sigma-K factor RskA
MTRDGKIGVAVRGWPLAPRFFIHRRVSKLLRRGSRRRFGFGLAFSRRRGRSGELWRRLSGWRAGLVAAGGNVGGFALGFRLAWAFFRRPPL